MRKFSSILFLLAALTVHADDDRAISNSLVRLDQLVEMVGVLEQAATNDAVRADCITDHLTKIRSLAELARTFSEALAMHLAETNSRAADGDLTMVQSACTRAEKLAHDVLNCQGAAPKNHSSAPATNSSTAAPAASPAPLPFIPVGDEATCLNQAKFAALLTQAMGVETDAANATPIQVLTKQSVEPPAGWRAEACVTVGDFCVVIARVLHLKIVPPNDAASYIQAVCNDGLPVDALGVRHPHEVLHEAAVRAFLAHGYAAQLPSSRPVQPE